jgi:biotin synthase-related radical SAM superfamily protein
MDEKKYVKVFASLGIYFGIVPSNIIDVNDLKGATANDDNKERLFSKDLNDVEVTSLYLMQHLEDGCVANCAFCAQSRESMHKRKKFFLVDKEMIRIPLETLKKFFISNPKSKELKRICIQTIYNGKTVENLFDIINAIREVSNVPITACSIPLTKDIMIKLKNAGLSNITINYETVTEELFNEIRGIKRNAPYRWEKVGKSLNDAIEVFGDWNVGSHLQIGLGETQKEAIKFIEELTKKKIKVSLFVFTPVKDTDLENLQRASHKQFHQIQLASYLIKNDLIDVEDMEFNDKGEIISYGLEQEKLIECIQSGTPFRNAGCSGCNRVYYETNPGERMYSYPRPLLESEIETIQGEILGKNYDVKM